jgi:hypothetical protein
VSVRFSIVKLRGYSRWTYRIAEGRLLGMITYCIRFNSTHFRGFFFVFFFFCFAPPSKLLLST